MCAVLSEGAEPSPTPRATAAQTSPETDREALVALYNATSGPNWDGNDNWLSDVPISEWEGVIHARIPVGMGFDPTIVAEARNLGVRVSTPRFRTHVRGIGQIIAKTYTKFCVVVPRKTLVVSIALEEVVTPVEQRPTKRNRRGLEQESGGRLGQRFNIGGTDEVRVSLNTSLPTGRTVACVFSAFGVREFRILWIGNDLSHDNIAGLGVYAYLG